MKAKNGKSVARRINGATGRSRGQNMLPILTLSIFWHLSEKAARSRRSQKSTSSSPKAE